MSASGEFSKQIRQRLLEGDPTAPSELALAYLDRLVHRLHVRFPEVVDHDMLEDAAVDAILNYTEHPSRFNPSKSSLATYLEMSARGDLLNALDREARRRKREVPLEVVEQRGPGRNILVREDELERTDLEYAGTGPAGPDLMNRMLESITDPRDQQLLQLMLNGERKTRAFAAVLDLEENDESEMRRAVKRHKDRLKKRLQRLGVKLIEQSTK